MIQISNRNFDILMEKLPTLIELIPSAGLSIKQREDIRLIKQVHRQLTRVSNKLKTKKC